MPGVALAAIMEALIEKLAIGGLSYRRILPPVTGIEYALPKKIQGRAAVLFGAGHLYAVLVEVGWNIQPGVVLVRLRSASGRLLLICSYRMELLQGQDTLRIRAGEYACPTMWAVVEMLPLFGKGPVDFGYTGRIENLFVDLEGDSIPMNHEPLIEPPENPFQQVNVFGGVRQVGKPIDQMSTIAGVAKQRFRPALFAQNILDVVCMFNSKGMLQVRAGYSCRSIWVDVHQQSPQNPDVLVCCAGWI